MGADIQRFADARHASHVTRHTSRVTRHTFLQTAQTSRHTFHGAGAGGLCREGEGLAAANGACV